MHFVVLLKDFQLLFGVAIVVLLAVEVSQVNDLIFVTLDLGVLHLRLSQRQELLFEVNAFLVFYIVLATSRTQVFSLPEVEPGHQLDVHLADGSSG